MDNTNSRALGSFDSTRRAIALYGALSTTALLVLVAVVGSGQPANTFMWVRAALLPVIALLVHRLTAAAARGSQRALDRLRALTLVMPVAIIGVDLIPGVCPPWYAAVQTLCMLPVIRAAFLLRAKSR
jgi:hypothetical protein